MLHKLHTILCICCAAAVSEGASLHLQGRVQQIVFGEENDIQIFRVNDTLVINATVLFGGDVRTSNTSLEDLKRESDALRARIDALENTGG